MRMMRVRHREREPPPTPVNQGTCTSSFDAYGFRSCVTSTVKSGSLFPCNIISPTGVVLRSSQFLGTVTTTYQIDTPTGPQTWIDAVTYTSTVTGLCGTDVQN